MLTGGPTGVAACYDEWSASYFEEYYGDDAPYPPVHVKLIADALTAHGVKTVLDAGCGPASILRTLVKREFDCWGFDLTVRMVEEARRVVRELAVPGERIWQGDAAQRSSYQHKLAGAPVQFDAAIAIGVLPHLAPAQVHATLENLHHAVRPGGLVIVQARNALFSLFTLNRNTHDFLRDELMAIDRRHEVSERAFIEKGLALAASQLCMDLPANRGGAGYDDTQPRAENPLTLPATFAAYGFSDVEVLFYHYHAAPPMCESLDRATFRALSLAMENARDWRGHFMASSFLLKGVRR